MESVEDCDAMEIMKGHSSQGEFSNDVMVLDIV